MQVTDVAANTALWRDVTNILLTTLMGLVAFVGRNLDKKLDRAVERLNEWNQGFTVQQSNQDLRIENHEWRLDELELPRGERRRSQRRTQS